MSVDDGEVRRIAELARLRLDDDEVERLTDEMNRILDHAARLREVGGPDAGGPDAGDEPSDVAGARGSEEIPPDELAHPLDEIAPDLRDGFFAVPPPPGVVGDGEAPEG